MLVQLRLGEDPTVIGGETAQERGLARARPHLDSILLRFSPNRQRGTWSAAWLPSNVRRNINRQDPDIVHLHWICGGYVPVQALRALGRPLVWTLHDMWPFTGGCHYSGDCTRYEQSCGACPQLNSAHTPDLSRWVWNRKKRQWRQLQLTAVGISHWLAHCARCSSLFRNVTVEVIPNGLDLQLYRPVGRQLARSLLGLPADRKLILFGSMSAGSDPRKGFHLLEPALRKFAEAGANSRSELVIFGSSEPRQGPNFGLKARYMGHLHDDISLVLLYNAADVFVAPSVADNFPNTVLEASACGTPCVAFDVGGLPDMISHRETGYLALPFDTEDLAAGIEWVVDDGARQAQLSQAARTKVEREFELTQVARRYRALYEIALGGA
jgi:glycosyltransferase involved in cell wall biosynthesis